jgi:hypothetical protein
MAAPTEFPPTETLLISGGDARLLLDSTSGLSIYGFRPRPDSQLIALGSSTASVISATGFAAAKAKRESLLEQLQRCSPQEVYAAETERLREELLRCCGLSPADRVDAVLAASGTDLHLLVAHWLRPQQVIMVAASETGTGLPAALQGRHFNSHTAYGETVPAGSPLTDWRSELAMLSPRHPDGNLRLVATVDTECESVVAEAAKAGQQVLLILTDVSKTGLIVPSICIAQELKARWPEQVEILVDACQFRLALETVRNYLMQGWLIALTGSKFMGGPSFSGILLVPESLSNRYRNAVLHPSVGAYSCQADWPASWSPACKLPRATNFGLLLRWTAALTELPAFALLPGAQIRDFLEVFGQAVRQRLTADEHFRELPVRLLSREELGARATPWDQAQTIFPFLLYRRGEGLAMRPFHREETLSLYRALLTLAESSSERRFHLGQPVACGQREGVSVSALRLCVSARMIVSACRDGNVSQVIDDALDALDEISRLIETHT